MNEVVNKFFLNRDKFIPTLHLRQARFTYSAWGPFTKYREKDSKIQKNSDLSYIYKNDLDKDYFASNAA